MNNKLSTLLIILSLIPLYTIAAPHTINRKQVVRRNNPIITQVDIMSSLTVGNGAFAFTADITGLQTFPEFYRNGIPLGTMSEWGWHNFDNKEKYKIEESYVSYDFGHGHKELYASQPKVGRGKYAADWFRKNPHRLHLGCSGLELEDVTPSDIKSPHQVLDMWTGEISSRFQVDNTYYNIKTACHPNLDMIASQITRKPANKTTDNNDKPLSVNFRFPYPTGAHSDNACDWSANKKHKTILVKSNYHSAILKHIIDSTSYYIGISWEGNATLKEKNQNYWVLSTNDNTLTYCFNFSKAETNEPNPTFAQTTKESADHWNKFWNEGAAIDFSLCKDKRAKELERRVVLSQYLLASQECGHMPPQETGLTYNSWFGKFHLEMTWWHCSWLALWGHPQALDSILDWYQTAEHKAHEIAKRQGFKGVRWMKMTDPSAEEAPSKVGSFLIWQQPHIIYLAELLYRATGDKNILEKYGKLVEETAEFMADFATYDKQRGQYILKGMIPAQETLKASTTCNSPFELSYWHYGLTVAQLWRERKGMERNTKWDDIIDKLAPLAKDNEGRYLAAESEPNTYNNIKLISDHPAVLGAIGVLPSSRLVDDKTMLNTLNWIMRGWNWNKTWGWDYPMTAMCATRLGKPDIAIDALMKDKRTNTYLPNGHNYQDKRLRCYLPGNGGLLTTIALMCAGWDGCETTNPGFPKDGQWNVVWEGLKPLP